MIPIPKPKPDLIIFPIPEPEVEKLYPSASARVMKIRKLCLTVARVQWSRLASARWNVKEIVLSGLHNGKSCLKTLHFTS